MSNVLPPPDSAKSPAASTTKVLRLPARLRGLAALLIILGLALVPSLVPLAQHVKDSQSPVNVTGVSTRQSGGSTVVTVSADAPLNRTQTWQDGDKFHLVLPYAASNAVKNLPRGVRVNRVSNSLEIVVNMKSGASVTVDPRFNRLNLIVNGGLNPAKDADVDEYATRPAATTNARTRGRAASDDNAEPMQPRPLRERYAPESVSSIPFISSRAANASSKSTASMKASAQSQSLTSTAPTERAQALPVVPATNAPATNNAPAVNTQTSTPPAPAQDNSLVTRDSLPASSAVAPPQAQNKTAQSGSFFSVIFSTTGVAILISLSLLALVYLRLRPSSKEADEAEAQGKAISKAKTKDEEFVAALESGAMMAEPPAVKTEKGLSERRRFLRRKSDNLAGARPQASPAAPAQVVSGPAVLFGAYRVDQEVGKLVLGQPHRMDVLASRAPDDRRAIETSLLKALNAVDTSDDGRRRARQALEEYGFLARHSAALLLAQDACDRAAAARTLGEIGAPIALPFLLEALYDSETIVRSQVVSSIGTLRLPSAIGALLDMARRHPEMPSALLSQALSACSLDCLDIGDAFESERPLLSGETEMDFNGEIKRLEPSATYEQLPEFMEDETLAEALERLENTDIEVRTAAARRLAQFQTQSSVAALTALAARDPEPVVRASAVSSLGEIDHESVFVPVLLAFADEAREVQAAAARSLSRLSFNRADAYARIIETADEEALGNVARACIKARMAAQAIDRLASEDRRHAYEAFSLLSLLAKANETEPILDAIAEHDDPNIQIAAIRLLGMTGRPEVAQQFRQLAVRDGLSEKVRTALLESVYKIDQALPV